MKSKIIYLAFLCLLTSSCVTARKCLQKFPPSIRTDSIYIERLKEIPVYIPGDTINVIAPVKCPDQDIVSFENSKLKQEIKILNGKLVSNTTIKPDTVIKLVPEIHTTVTEIKVPQPVKFVPQLYKIALWLWIGVVVAIAGYVAFRIFIKK
jgi:hypothetical protein